MSDGSCIVSSRSRKSSGDAADRFSSINTSQDSEYGGVYEGHVPIIGYIKATEPCILTVYSLKNETAVSILRFGYAILKFQTNIVNPENKGIVLLSDGTIHTINLKSMSIEVSLQTFFIDSDKILRHSMSGGASYAERNMLMQLAQSLPKYFDMSSDCYAYIYNSIN